MFLHQEGKLDPEAPVSHYIPEFGQNGKDKITVAQVMTHTAGLKVFYDFNVRGLRSKESILDFIYADQLWHPVGETVYSDLSMMVVGELVERVAGRPLDRFVHHAIFRPLGMHCTGFRPIGGTTSEGEHHHPDVVPTEFNGDFRQRLLWGEVHDPNAYLMGGVAGHAGLFSTAADIARFCFMLLNGGLTPDGRRLFAPHIVQRYVNSWVILGEFMVILRELMVRLGGFMVILGEFMVMLGEFRVMLGDILVLHTR
jgi:CubicO group peptidase (beta-lactamase class C family)